MMKFWVNWGECDMMTENQMETYRSELRKELADFEIRELYRFSDFVSENYKPTDNISEAELRDKYEAYIAPKTKKRTEELIANEGWEFITLSD